MARSPLTLLLIAVALGAGLLAAGAPASPHSTAADASLVGRWHLDEIDGANGIAVETTPDSSGNGLIATVSTVELSAGKFGNAFDVTSGNAAPSGVDVRSDPRLAPQNPTVFAWVKRTGSPGQYAYVAAKGARQCSAASYGLYTGASGGLFFYVNLGQSTAVSPDAGQGIWDGNWHAVAGVYDGQRVRLYVDGTEVGGGTPATGSIAYGNEDVSHDLTIGFYPGGASCTAQFSGRIDEVEVYNRALQPSEVHWLATGDGSGPPELPPPGSTTTTGQTTTTTSTTTTNPTTTTAATTTTTTTGSSLAAHIVSSQSKALSGGLWFDASVAAPAGAGQIVKYAWDTNGDGSFDLPCGVGANRGATSSAVSIAFASPGQHTVGVQVTDSTGHVGTATTTVNVKANEATNAGKLVGNVVDCENPGANNAPDRADCVKTFAFGIIEVNSRGEAADCFRITSQSLASKVARTLQGVPGKSKKLVQVYHAEIDGPIAINGLYVPVPERQHSAYDTFDSTIGLGNHQTLFGTYKTLPVNLNLTVDPDKHGYFKVADVALSGAIPSIGGLKPDAGVTLGFVNHKTEVDFHLKLPKIFKFGNGDDAEASATFFMSNEDGLVFDGGQLGPVDVFLGPMIVRKLQLAYSKSKTGHVMWSGGAILQLLDTGLGLDAAPPPPDKGFGLKDGQFDHAGVGVIFPLAAQPQLFPGLFLTHIDISLGRSPLRFTGSAGLSAAHVMDMDGEVFVVFASNGEPYEFPDQSGDLQPLAGRDVTSFAIAVGGTGSLDVPVIGKIPLADGFLFYEYPSFFEISGGFKFEVSFLRIDGGVHGFVDGSSGKWDYDMGVKACLNRLEIWEVSLDGVCLSVGGVISSKGLGFCGVVPVPTPFGAIPVDVGAGYAWGDSFPDLMVFDCDYGPWKESVEEALRTLQAGVDTVTLPGGPAAMIRVLGVGGTPDVTLTGPGGKTISTASPAVDKNIAVVKLADANETLIAFRNPAGGRWTVTPVGSVPVASIATSAGLLPPRITARVVGAGGTRTLVYTLANAKDATVTFAELGRGSFRELGKASAAKGRLRFTPATGPAGKRQIVAEVTRNGSPVRKLVVTTYVAPGPAGLRPPEPHVVRRGGALIVGWHAVPGAIAYSVTLESRGARTMSVVKGTSARFAGFSTAGTAIVGALGATGAHGPLAQAAFKATPSPRSGKKASSKKAR
jgi:hypothetical protein